jgi:phosphohistidine swiveling domain-containing protein
MIHIDFSKDYKRLFRFDGFYHFFNDNWMVSYKKRDALVLTLGENTTMYLPQEVITQYLQEGCEFFVDDAKFEAYIKEYETFIPLFKDYFANEIKDKDVVELAPLTRFFELTANVFDFFYRTEFFYLDEVYKLSDSNPTIKKNLEIHYKLKERARLETLNDAFFGEKCYMGIITEKLSAQFGVSKKNLLNYGVAELLALYEGKKVAEAGLIERDIARIIVAIDGRVQYVFGEEAKKDILEFKEKTEDAIPYGATTLKGTPTNKGKVTGKVKIITSTPQTIDRIHEEFAKMEKGDILVAETTSPEYMPAIRIAGAILADQGGLLSHAAVTSREFGIPSIVALKYATKVLKDGDRVEVDGEKGVVTIL